MRMIQAVRLATLLPCAGALAATPCFIQRFAAMDDTGGFDGGSNSYSNPGTGGVGGAGDGYLLVENFEAAFLGARQINADYIGDHPGAGIVRVTFWLNDVGEKDDLEIHLGLGAAFANFWQSDQPCVPAHNEWRKFSVEIAPDDAGWTLLIGDGTLADALAGADRFLLRHDVAPYTSAPEPVAADLGIDNVRLIAGPCDCPEDVDDDGDVDFADLNFVLSDYNREGAGLPGDVDFSGGVTFDDLNRVLGVYNMPCPTSMKK